MLSPLRVVTLVVTGLLGLPAAAAELPGQAGPTAALRQPGQLRLTTRRTEELFPDGNRIWKVELHRGDQRLASWRAMVRWSSAEASYCAAEAPKAFRTLALQPDVMALPRPSPGLFSGQPS